MTTLKLDISADTLPLTLTGLLHYIILKGLELTVAALSQREGREISGRYNAQYMLKSNLTQIVKGM